MSEIELTFSPSNRGTPIFTFLAVSSLKILLYLFERPAGAKLYILIQVENF